MPRRRKTPLTNNTTTTASSTIDGNSGTPPPQKFFTLAIEGPNTAVALDAFGTEIVSLHFDDFNDLTSDDFLQYAAAAVTAVAGSDSNDSSEFTRPESDVISLLDSENSSEDDDVYIEEDIDEIFAAVLAENEALAAQHAFEHLDADLALALKLQEEEEQEKEKEEKQKRIRAGGNPWGSNSNSTTMNTMNTINPMNTINLVGGPPGVVLQPPLPTTNRPSSNHSTFSNIMGSAPGISLSTQNMNYKGASTTSTNTESEFPSLPPPTTTRAAREPFPFSTISSSQHKRRVPSVPTLAPTLAPTLLKSSSSITTIAEPPIKTNITISGKKINNTIKDAEDLSTKMFLDSYDEDAIEARATALRYTQAASAKQPRDNTGATTASRQTFKKMMDSSSNTNILREDGGSKYCRRKIRTLVMSMIAAGWEFMPDRRGSGHYMYRRIITLPHCQTGHKQILVLPCTPSSQRSIEAVHSRLQRMDREAEAVRAAAALEDGGGNGGKVDFKS